MALSILFYHVQRDELRASNLQLLKNSLTRLRRATVDLFISSQSGGEPLMIYRTATCFLYFFDKFLGFSELFKKRLLLGL